MDFKSTPIQYHPAYTWLWNTTITKDGIKERIDEMYDSGIRAFYVLGEPENFRPHVRRTHLYPEYLSDEYVDLVYYAYEYGKKKGMNSWLYNEGGFPSGMACGKIRQMRPDLAQKIICSHKIKLVSGEKYQPSEATISAFCGGTRVCKGDSFDEDTEIIEYFYSDNNNEGRTIQSDIASYENADLFIKLTHEKLKARFGAAMGTDVKLMFDDEAFMGTWTKDLDKIFYNKYGYEINDFLPYIMGDSQPNTEAQYRAKSDYIMLAGDLVRDNYFTPMKDWLNKNGMLSTGHIDNDHLPNGNVVNRYGNLMKTLREFDVPGVDVIWSQITYPDENAEFEGMKFFPRFASSAARQNGHSDALSESFAVFGAHVDPELMRYVVNYQAVRGISLYNFMVMSYDRKTPMMHQYRPNFVKENVGMDRLGEINNYTARLSHILSSARADIKNALYYPARSIAAGGIKGKCAADDFTRIGHELEEKGISFDIVDEELILGGKIDASRLVLTNVIYENILTPTCDFEIPEVKNKLALIGKDPASDIERKSNYLLTRKMIFDNGDEGYFIVNTSNEKTEEIIKIPTDKNVYEIQISDGEAYSLMHTKNGDKTEIPISLLRGEGIFILASSEEKRVLKRDKKIHVADITNFRSYISRREVISCERGTANDYYESGEIREGLYEWDKSFSGEVTYTAHLPPMDDGEYIVELGEVRSTATVYVDEDLVGSTTLPPYFVKISNKKHGRDLKIVVANTPANECARTDYFDKMDVKDVGGYHPKMKFKEMQAKPGGLLGPVKISKIIRK